MRRSVLLSAVLFLAASCAKYGAKDSGVARRGNPVDAVSQASLLCSQDDQQNYHYLFSAKDNFLIPPQASDDNKNVKGVKVALFLMPKSKKFNLYYGIFLRRKKQNGGWCYVGQDQAVHRIGKGKLTGTWSLDGQTLKLGTIATATKTGSGGKATVTITFNDVPEATFLSKQKIDIITVQSQQGMSYWENENGDVWTIEKAKAKLDCECKADAVMNNGRAGMPDISSLTETPLTGGMEDVVASLTEQQSKSENPVQPPQTNSGNATPASTNPNSHSGNNSTPTHTSTAANAATATDACNAQPDLADNSPTVQSAPLATNADEPQECDGRTVDMPAARPMASPALPVPSPSPAVPRPSITNKQKPK